MKTIHPKNVSDEQLIDSMIANLRRTPSIDVSIIKDELMRRLSSVQQSVQPDVCHAQEMLTVYPDAELRDFVGYKVLGWLLIGVAFVANGYVAFANIDVTPMRLLVSYWPIYLASLVALGLGMTLVSE